MNQDNAIVEAVVEAAPTAIESMTKAEFDVAVATAHKFPRSIKRFKDRAMAMATIDEDVAQQCYYMMSRQGTQIEGPSVRFAEIVANSYGNLRYGARIIDIGQEEVTAQGIAHDLENNVSATLEVKRRITDRNGRRYSQDMILVTCNAASSIAMRNAIFRTVPFALAKPIYDAARMVAVGDAKTLRDRRTKMLGAFASMGIEEARVFGKLGIESAEDINLDHVAKMVGLYNAIKDGDADPDAEFPEIRVEQIPDPEPPKKRGAEQKGDAQ